MTQYVYSPHIGVADGVGGWREEGVDPSLFTVSLMQRCTHVSTSPGWTTPVEILEQAYQAVVRDQQVLAGVRV